MPPDLSGLGLEALDAPDAVAALVDAALAAQGDAAFADDEFALAGAAEAAWQVGERDFAALANRLAAEHPAGFCDDAGKPLDRLARMRRLLNVVESRRGL